MKKISFILFAVFIFSFKSSGQYEFDAFNSMREGYFVMEFLSKCESNILKEDDWSTLLKTLKTDGLYPSNKKKQIEIANNKVSKISNSHFFINIDSTENLIIEDFSSKLGLIERWKEIDSNIGKYSGIQNRAKGKYYLKLEGSQKINVNATFRTDKYIISVKQQLSFSNNKIDNWTTVEIDEYLSAINKINNRLSLLEKYLIAPKDQMYKSLDGRLLTQEERLFGFFTFWSEVEYNFAFFDQVPDLDWKQVLIDYIPIVSVDQTNLEYYQTLAKVCALLNDGHTNIYFPDQLTENLINPPLKFTEIGNQIFLTNFDKSLDPRLALGLELISIDDLKVSDYLHENILPYISSSTDHIKRKQSISKMLEGQKDSKIKLGFKNSDKKQLSIDIVRAYVSNENWIRKASEWNLVSFQKKDNTGIIEINSFGRNSVVELFEQYIDSIKGAQNLIIDLRNNGGGNSSNGYEILKYFTKEPIITSKWSTREHKASYKAWGKYIDNSSEELNEWASMSKKTYQGDYWYESPPDTLLSNHTTIFDIPVIVLIGNNTASAAEDFLVAAESIPSFKTVGDYTYGSTGQPLIMNLPGGGSARICTKRDMYPNGKEFVGYGIKPDFIVKETLEDILSGRDSVLEYAIKILNKAK